MSWGRAALGGLMMGAWLGVLLGLFVSLFATSEANLWTLVGLGLIYGGGVRHHPGTYQLRLHRR